MSPLDTLEFLLVGGLLGLFGQLARAAVGLKTLSDYANGPDPREDDVFDAARLLISLAIGFGAGIAAALTYKLKVGDQPIATLDNSTLISFALSGYVGADILEAFISKYFVTGTPAGGTASRTRGSPSSGTQMSIEDLKSSLDSYSAVQERLSSLALPAVRPSVTKQEIVNFLKLIYSPADLKKYKDSDPIPEVDAGQADANLTKISDWFNSKGVAYRLGYFDLPSQKWTYDSLAVALGQIFAKHGGVYVP